MWVDVALALVGVWLLVAAGVGCAVGRAVRIADARSECADLHARRVVPTPERG